MPILRAEDLTHTYSVDTPFEKVAVDHLNFEIADHDFIGVIGHTGSGKSTLIQMLNGLLPPTSGKIYFQDRDITEKKYNKKDLRFQVGLVFQYPEYQLFEETVEKDIAFGPKNMDLSADEIENRVAESLRFVGLDDSIRTKSPFELSGGQKRRVAIAGIMAMRPRVLILDEPTAGLDPKGCDEILARIREYHQQEKSTVLLVSHSMEDIAMNAKNVMVMHEGKLAMYAPTEDVFERAEELTAMRLDVPQITRVFMTLKKQGHPVSHAVFSMDGAVREVKRILSI